MELRIGKYDIYFAWHKWFRIGYDKEVYPEDKITFRNIYLGFLCVYVDTWEYI